ncbi:MAG: hypothetical protein AAB817_02640 [Patescibacteria group bacterium]
MDESSPIRIHWSLKPFHFCLHALRRRWHVRYQFNPAHLIADLMFLATIIALVAINGYIFFVFTKWTAGLQIQLTVEAPLIASGSPTTVTVKYANTAYRGAVTDARLIVEWPVGFTVTAVAGGHSDGTDGPVVIGTIPPHDRNAVTFQGVWWANDGEQAPIKARLIYTQESPFGPQLRWEDSRTASDQLSLVGSGVACAITGPPDLVVVGTPFEATVTCRNAAVDAVTDIVVQLPTTPYSIGPTAGGAITAAGQWLVGTLAADEERSTPVTLTRNPVEPPVDRDELRFEVRGKHVGQSYVLAHPVKSWAVYQPAIDWRATFTPTPFPGEVATYQINITNRESVNWQQPVLRLQFPASAIDPVTGTASDPAWQKTAAGWELAYPGGQLAPQATWTTDFTVKIKSRPLGEIVAVVQPTLTYSRPLADRITTVTTWGPTWTEKLSTDLEATVGARYYTRDGIQLGLGPLPPIVGFPTRYRVLVVVTNTLHDVSAGRLVMTLPPAVFWDQTCSTPAELVTFDQSSRQLVIDFKTVAASTLQNSAVADASFCLTIIPTAGQVGTTPPLAVGLRFTGQDAVTGRAISHELNSITTNLLNDPLSIGKGKVIK